MTAVKKTPISADAAYKLAAAARRAKVAASIVSIDREVHPIAGRIRAVLSGKPISRERQDALFGASAIDLPEFRPAHKKPA